MKINLPTIKNIEDIRSVPPGDYRCKVAEVRESESPADHTRWGIRWEVIKGEFQRRMGLQDVTRGNYLFYGQWPWYRNRARKQKGDLVIDS